jgi:predicted DCC family thiol-disulfide oxidoreductase YuxK
MSANAENAIDPATPQRPVVLFDGGCPMCSREIAHYRRRRGADRIDWIDIATADALQARYGVSPDDAMARFHVRDPRGCWQTGAWGFVELWSHLATYRWLAGAMRSLRLTGILDFAYTGFARWRLRRRCDETSCTTDSTTVRTDNNRP